ncbi:hypothetical protein DFJ73DRAFT_592837 [Zopfochytrium polystomum]|nr:hypothetical protein DFJ73DRAFT_592837 [Zopfochytrium polystomum]
MRGVGRSEPAIFPVGVPELLVQKIRRKLPVGREHALDNQMLHERRHLSAHGLVPKQRLGRAAQASFLKRMRRDLVEHVKDVCPAPADAELVEEAGVGEDGGAVLWQGRGGGGGGRGRGLSALGVCAEQHLVEAQEGGGDFADGGVDVGGEDVFDWLCGAGGLLADANQRRQAGANGVSDGGVDLCGRWRLRCLLLGQDGCGGWKVFLQESISCSRSQVPNSVLATSI